MAKDCFFCGAKLSFFNSVDYDGFSLCYECNDIYNYMSYARTPEDLLKTKTKLLNLAGNNQAAIEVISNRFIITAERFGMNDETIEEYHARKEAERQKEEEEVRRQEEKLRREAEERRREKEERQRREQESLDNFLKENGHEGYYEYKVLSLRDESSGCIDINSIYIQLNELGRQGWHLRCAFTNEIGKESSSAGIGGFSTGTNASIDQNILILERFIKFK